MRTLPLALVASGALMIAGGVRAGTDQSISRDLAVGPPPTATSDWEFSVGLPGWLSGINGDIGVAGLKPVHVDLPFSDLVQHLDMVAGLSVEARHKRWGFYLVGLYEKLGADGDPPGRLVDSVGLSLREVIAEAGVTYRVWEGKRGYLDLLAGARLIYMGADMNFDVDSSGVDEVSRDLVDSAASRVSGAVEHAVSEFLPEIKGVVASRIATATESRIRRQVDRILQSHPRLPDAIGAISGHTGPVSDAVRRLIAANVAAKQATLTGIKAAASAEVAAAKARAKARLQREVQRAKQNLANQIAAAIKKAIPSEVSGSKSWVDPFVGVRGRFNFTDNLYATARADIGGFSVGSRLAWQFYGALGWQFNRHWSTELGYRYLSEDYENGGFVFDGVVAGAYLGVTYQF